MLCKYALISPSRPSNSFSSSSMIGKSQFRRNRHQPSACFHKTCLNFAQNCIVSSRAVLLSVSPTKMARTFYVVVRKILSTMARTLAMKVMFGLSAVSIIKCVKLCINKIAVNRFVLSWHWPTNYTAAASSLDFTFQIQFGFPMMHVIFFSKLRFSKKLEMTIRN